jgi:CPA1 family monovalent cation:H+ antiporter
MQLNHQLAGKNVLGYYGLKQLIFSTRHTTPPREPEEMEQFLSTETLIIELLLIVAIVAVVVRRFRVPYTVALVVVGLLITFQSPIKIELTPELIMALFVPPLVFEAAFHLNLVDLRRNLPTILLLAVPGVILTTFIVGGMLVLGINLSLPLALIFGALIAATDPVSVVALFRTLGVPKRLSVLIEGESLFNDGTAIVLFNLMLAIALTGKFNLADSVVDFFVISIGGILVGLILGWLVAQLISRVDNYLIETTFTTILAFGSYLVAERFGLSGVLAVVAAGLVNGNISPQGMSPTSRIVIFNFWEYVAFLANSLIFLLLGLQINITSLLSAWQPILWAVFAILVARFIIVYGLSWLGNRFSEPIPLRWQHILNWGGLRGAISLALVLSLPAEIGPQRDLLRVMAYGVVLFTLLIQSTSMGSLVRKLKIITRSEAQVEYEIQHARLTALRSADSRLDRMHNDGLLSSHTWERLKRSVTGEASVLAEKVRGMLLADPALEAEELETGWREMLRAQRNSLLSLRHDGVISEEVFEQLATEVDAQLMEGSPTLVEDAETRTQFLEITIPDDSLAIGKTIAELGIPRAAVLVSIQRGDETIIPRGDTLVHAGDVVTTLCEREIILPIKHLLLNPGEHLENEPENPEHAED